MKNILVVDDDPQVRNIIRVILSRQGFNIIEAANGRSALQRLSTEAFDIIVTDILMPEKDGLEIILEIKTRFPELKIIAMSGGGRILDPDLYLNVARQLGADVLLHKPLPMRMLLKTIHDLSESEIVADQASTFWLSHKNGH